MIVDVTQVDTAGTERLDTRLIVDHSNGQIIWLAADTEAEQDNLDGRQQELKDEEPSDKNTN